MNGSLIFSVVPVEQAFPMGLPPNHCQAGVEVAALEAVPVDRQVRPVGPNSAAGEDIGNLAPPSSPGQPSAWFPVWHPSQRGEVAGLHWPVAVGSHVQAGPDRDLPLGNVTLAVVLPKVHPSKVSWWGIHGQEWYRVPHSIRCLR